MAWTRHTLTEHCGIEEILTLIRRHYPTIDEIVVSQDARSLGTFIDVREKDYGVWEWNEEVI